MRKPNKKRTNTVHDVAEDFFMKTAEELLNGFTPFNEQERKDAELIRSVLDLGDETIWTRQNRIMHLTASAWVVDHSRTKALMAYHNIYKSWSWLGGHADGERDLSAVALREVMEESGVRSARLLSPDLYSVEVLTVDGHVKKGEYVSSHLHLNFTFLIEADEEDLLTVREGENSGVSWFLLDEAVRASSEPWFREHIYSKLNMKLARLMA